MNNITAALGEIQGRHWLQKQAYDDEQLIGAILSGHDGRGGYIYHIVVLSEYRGR